MHCISMEDGNVLLHKGEIGIKLRRLIKYMGLSGHHKTICMLSSIDDSDCP